MGREIERQIKNRRDSARFLARGWLRRGVGVGLIGLSVALGMYTVERADQRVDVIVAAQNISAGVRIQQDDLSSMPMHLGSSLSRYFTSAAPLIGQIAQRDFRVGELLTRHQNSDRIERVVALPVRIQHLPNIVRGDRIDIWWTRISNGEIVGLPRIVAERLVVVAADNVQRNSMAGSIFVSVQPEQVLPLIQAIESGVISVILR